MNKSELIEAVATESGQPKTVVTKVVDALCNQTVVAVKQGETVKLAGFGQYAPQFKPARTARNPRTGEAVNVAESRGVKFKASEPVLKYLNGR